MGCNIGLRPDECPDTSGTAAEGKGKNSSGAFYSGITDGRRAWTDLRAKRPWNNTIFLRLRFLFRRVDCPGVRSASAFTGKRQKREKQFRRHSDVEFPIGDLSWAASVGYGFRPFTVRSCFWHSPRLWLHAPHRLCRRPRNGCRGWGFLCRNGLGRCRGLRHDFRYGGNSVGTDRRYYFN